MLLDGEQYSTCCRVINVAGAALWAVGSQPVWDPMAHNVAAAAFITLLHVKYFLPPRESDWPIFV